jgi:hypothetical protein
MIGAAKKIREAYDIISGHNENSWVTINTIQSMTGMRKDELHAAIRELLDADRHFRAEPEPFHGRITENIRQHAVEIGGEARHKIAWF